MHRLLVIDDDPLVRTLVTEAFHRTHAVQTASTAAVGVDQFQKQRPDVVLLDVHLPDSTGHNVFRRLHAIDATVPVIFITASGDSDLAIEATKLGCYDYLLKPLDLRSLEELVTRALHVRRLMSVRVDVNAAPESPPDKGDALIGRCHAMQDRKSVPP